MLLVMDKSGRYKLFQGSLHYQFVAFAHFPIYNIYWSDIMLRLAIASVIYV